MFLHHQKPSSPIPLRLLPQSFFFLFLFLCISPSLSNSKSSSPTIKISPLSPNQTTIHSPVPSSPSPLALMGTANPNNYKLRRLPHVFGKVLELPLDSDAEVSMEEHPGCFRYIAETEVDLGEVRAHLVEVHLGVQKVVVINRRQGGGGSPAVVVDEINLHHVRRVRLPEATRPEMATAVFGGGKLVVMVPKSRPRGQVCKEGRLSGGGGLGEGDLVLVC